MTFDEWITSQQAPQQATCWIIAEAGVNHNGRVSVALELVDVAARAGADAVKFQTFRTEDLVQRDAPLAQYQEKLQKRDSQFDMLEGLELNTEEFRKVAQRCRDHNIEFLSTPFDRESTTLVVELGASAMKISSTDLTNIPFLWHVAALGRPVILSTGMGYIAEVEDAVRALEDGGAVDIVLLHCTSNYPTEPSDVNLRAMETLRSFGYPVGLSDHTLGTHVSVAAVARGARMVEKHFTLDRSMEGPDHQASLAPDQLARLVREIREVEAALGVARKRPAASEADGRRVIRRSLVAARDLEKGHVLRPEDLGAMRPADGISPRLASQLAGRRLMRDLSAGERLEWADIE